jgi:hypothetical protein
VSRTRLGRRIGRSVPAGLRVPGGPGSHELVRLTTRLVIAQAAAAAAIGLPFSRRQVPTVAMTLIVVAALCLLAAIARTGLPTARNVLLFFEVFIAAIGLYRFAFARYLGGTLFAIVITGVLLHPAVARAYDSLPKRRASSAEAVPDDGGALDGGALGGGALGGTGTVPCGDHGGER